MHACLLSFLLVFVVAVVAVPLDGARNRRDVSEVSKEYLPPTEKTISNDYLPPPTEEVSTESAVLGEKGYEYRTVRRLKYRHRRDVSDISPEYLPPAEEAVTEVAAAAEPKNESAVLGSEGYEYKTVRRLRYRHRRDASDISPEYLPPAEETVTEAATADDDTAVLAENGYEYKTVRRLRYRHRRDVSELSPEYLPPAEESMTEVSAVEPVEDSAVLGKDGYEYKTVRRLKYRLRRDASEISPEYLPPAAEVATEVTDTLQPENESATLTKNGYEYKTVRRLRLRQRRDVSELAAKYLPPVVGVSTQTPVSEETTIKSSDGYHYEAPENRLVAEPPKYLPPNDDSVAVEGPKESAVLKEDGYHYRRVYRL